MPSRSPSTSRATRSGSSRSVIPTATATGPSVSGAAASPADGIGGVRRPTEDPRQLGGDFVIDGEGRLVWGFWGDGPDHRPAIGDLIAAVRNAAR